MTFKSFLLAQTHRTDSVGELARWVKENPPMVTRWGQADLRRHMWATFLGSNRYVGIRAFQHACGEFRASERQRKAAK